MKKEFKIHLERCSDCDNIIETYVNDEKIMIAGQFQNHSEDAIRGLTVGIRLSGNDIAITSSECLCESCSDKREST